MLFYCKLKIIYDIDIMCMCEWVFIIYYYNVINNVFNCIYICMCRYICICIFILVSSMYCIQIYKFVIEYIKIYCEDILKLY